MDPQSIWETITQVFRETLEDDTIELSEETTASDVEDWDSITHIQLMVAVEQAFGIRISTGEVANLANVGQLVRLIEQRLNQ
jgi:acyl carrier protein